ncbi:Protein CBG25597 [Caenorhabditis briggsae]|uniref:Protein CBG25597 n=1 Tax=Caenorhabditis briggsae TaxID=6238 RepID=B6IF82_CAEBR|nr:Protein CBG25597 [Caenorhabditis briggsae]CAR98562.1 Protein CBG25597 [Caenorhabditis briggsae]
MNARVLRFHTNLYSTLGTSFNYLQYAVRKRERFQILHRR